MIEIKVILEELEEKLNTKERVLAKIFKKTFVKVYRLGMLSCFNYFNK